MIRNKNLQAGGSHSGLRPRRLTFKSAVRQVMRNILMDQFMVLLECQLRPIVQKELDRSIQRFLSQPLERTSLDLIQTSKSDTSLQLRFVNLLPKAIFTTSKLRAEDGSALMVELIDSNTETRVTSGPFASSRVEIVVLRGDFAQQTWDKEQFKANILHERKDRRPLITGDCILMLNEGVALITNDLVVTDNSSWTRSGSFRLGARLLQKMGFSSRVQEAKSEEFVCRDQRGESYRKHYPPFPCDEVWRLVKIAKDGAFHSRLTNHGINTVKDFLRLYITDPAALRTILGDGALIPNKAWEAMVSHSLRCVLDGNECYIYNGVGQRARLRLNSVYDVEAVSFEDSPFQPAAQLTFAQKLALAELKLEAYSNINQLIPVNGHALRGPIRPLPSPQDEPLRLPNSDQHGSLLSFSHGVQPNILPSYDPSSYAWTPYSCNLVGAHSVQPNAHSFQVLPPELRNSFKGSCPEGHVVRRGELENGGTSTSHSHLFTSDWSPGSISWAQANGLNMFPDTVSGTLNIIPNMEVQISGIGRSKRGWCKIRAALKLGSVWQYTVARKTGRKYLHKPFGPL